MIFWGRGRGKKKTYIWILCNSYKHTFHIHVLFYFFSSRFISSNKQKQIPMYGVSVVGMTVISVVSQVSVRHVICHVVSVSGNCGVHNIHMDPCGSSGSVPGHPIQTRPGVLWFGILMRLSFNRSRGDSQFGIPILILTRWSDRSLGHIRWSVPVTRITCHDIGTNSVCRKTPR